MNFVDNLYFRSPPRRQQLLLETLDWFDSLPERSGAANAERDPDHIFDYFEDANADQPYPHPSEMHRFCAHYYIKKWIRRHRRKPMLQQAQEHRVFVAKTRITRKRLLRTMRRWRKMAHSWRVQKLQLEVARMGMKHKFIARLFLRYWAVRAVIRRRAIKRKVLKFWERFWLLTNVMRKVSSPHAAPAVCMLIYVQLYGVD